MGQVVNDYFLCRAIHKFDVYQKSEAGEVDLGNFCHLVSAFPSLTFLTLILLAGPESGRNFP